MGRSTGKKYRQQSLAHAREGKTSLWLHFLDAASKLTQCTCLWQWNSRHSVSGWSDAIWMEAYQRGLTAKDDDQRSTPSQKLQFKAVGISPSPIDAFQKRYFDVSVRACVVQGTRHIWVLFLVLGPQTQKYRRLPDMDHMAPWRSEWIP